MLLPNCLAGLVLTAGLATAGPVRLPLPQLPESAASTVASVSITDLVSGAREALLGYLTIPLGSVPFPDGKPQSKLDR